MKKKKDLPLVILKSLQPFVNLKGEKFEKLEQEENLLKVIDKDEESNFHFTIEDYKKAQNGRYHFLMSRSPTNQNERGEVKNWVEISQLETQFQSWLRLLEEYENVESFFDDPIIRSFTEEFYSEFEIIDDDADKNPLNTKQILLLDSYLEDITKRLSDFSTETNSHEIADLQKNIIELRNNLTNNSKKWVVERLSNIWAKIAKQGTNFIKEFLSESKKEVIKRGVKGMMGFIENNGSDFLT